MPADRGASGAGIDAAQELIEFAAERTPEGDFRVGDLEALSWPDDSFNAVTGFSVFQFADDKVRALTDAQRVSRAGGGGDPQPRLRVGDSLGVRRCSPSSRRRR